MVVLNYLMFECKLFFWVVEIYRVYEVICWYKWLLMDLSDGLCLGLMLFSGIFILMLFIWSFVNFFFF